MTKVLIADALKSSVVMSSEIFKDKIPGATIRVASTGQDALEIIQQENFDLCLIDFDLPDSDGPALISAMRKVFNGPILMSAYPDKVVEQVAEEELFTHMDASAWIKKPVRAEDLSEKISEFIIDQKRTGRRFDFEIPSKLVAKASGRGKRAPKSEGHIVNLSVGGACFLPQSDFDLTNLQELTLSFKVPEIRSESKIKAKIAWQAKSGEVGLRFEDISEAQHKQLTEILRMQFKQSHTVETRNKKAS